MGILHAKMPARSRSPRLYTTDEQSPNDTDTSAIWLITVCSIRTPVICKRQSQSCQLWYVPLRHKKAWQIVSMCGGNVDECDTVRGFTAAPSAMRNVAKCAVSCDRARPMRMFTPCHKLRPWLRNVKNKYVEFQGILLFVYRTQF